ncbi:MAG: VWA domain-containing protein [Bryobacteraceae bacterium]|jgi:Ca-activated chloride channel family protein
MSKSLPVALVLFTALARLAGQTMSTDARLVLVPVSVTDSRGATVTGLERGNFTLFEDKRPRDIVAFSAEDSPLSAGLVFDISGSMRGKLDLAKSTLRAFADNANATDEAFLFTVSSRPGASSGFTTDLSSLAEEASFLKAAGDTALIDTVYEGLERMRSASHARRVLLILSDGMDNHSRRSRSELMRMAQEANVQVYAIAIDARVRTGKALEQQDAQRGLAFLQDLADNTGGLRFIVSDRDDPRSVIARAILSMRNQYLLAYRPAQPVQPGKWHRIRVKLNVAHTNVSARNGYSWQ